MRVLLQIRRIEAITSDVVNEYYSDIEETLQQIKSIVKNNDVLKGVSDLVLKNKDLSKKLKVINH